MIRLTLLTLVLFFAVSGFYWAVSAGIQRYLDDYPFQVVDPGMISPPVTKDTAGKAGDAGAGGLSHPPRKTGQRAEKPGRHPIETELLLLGTVAGDPNVSFAIIKDRSLGDQGLYRLGQSIRGGVIAEILREKVIIVSGNRRFVLSVRDDDAQGLNEGGGAVGVAVDDIRNALDHVDQALSQIDVQPYDAGGIKGLEITNVAPGSIFDRFGLRRGDILQGVNNVSIQNPQIFVDLFVQMKSLPVSLSFESLDEEAVGVLTRFNPAAKGIGTQVASVVKKMKSGQDIDLEFIRAGEAQRKTYRIE
ncbi:MAG: hypothetical protein JEZ11_11805 [Desulfobacterales bacterium]|nr:hypothetical protein [Desulfobacterales bacterium]